MARRLTTIRSAIKRFQVRPLVRSSFFVSLIFRLKDRETILFLHTLFYQCSLSTRSLDIDTKLHSHSIDCARGSWGRSCWSVRFHCYPASFSHSDFTI
jgi:hypothetical protein